MTKKQKIGLALILVPPAVFILNLVVFSIISFVLIQGVDSASIDAATGLANAAPGGAVAGVLRVLSGLVGLVSGIGTPVGFIVGLILILTGAAPVAPQPPAPPTV